MAGRRCYKLLLPLVVAIGLGCAAAAVFLWAPDNTGLPRVPREPVRIDASEGESVQGEESVPRVSAAPPASIDVPSLETLWRLCPDPWVDSVGDDCQAALADRYRDEGMRTVRLHHNGLLWERPHAPLSVEITWDDAFARPLATRRTVDEALGDPSCREFVVHETAEVLGVADAWTDPVSAKLQARCAADEAATLGMLFEGCEELLRSTGRLDHSPQSTSAEETAGFALRSRDTSSRHEYDWNWHIEQLDNDATFGPEQYWRRREEIDDARFRFAWRRLKCYAVEPAVFAMFDSLPEGGAEIHQGHHLRRYAARLGNDWAIAVAQRFEERIWDRN